MFRYEPPEGTSIHTVYSHITRPASKRVKPFKGNIRLWFLTRSLWARRQKIGGRGKLSDGRTVLIEQTQAIAARHPTLHMSPAAKRRYFEQAQAT